MSIDRHNLETFISGKNPKLLIRFFEWKDPTVSYGYLMDKSQVAIWAQEKKVATIVQRPTGGGTVHHDRGELSLSLLWGRKDPILPSQPRQAYEAIHKKLKKSLEETLRDDAFQLFVKETGLCASPAQTKPIKRFSVCFTDPVCNDVMLEGTKVIGGALRLTREAILYQGSIQVKGLNIPAFKNR